VIIASVHRISYHLKAAELLKIFIDFDLGYCVDEQFTRVVRLSSISWDFQTIKQLTQSSSSDTAIDRHFSGSFDNNRS